MKYSVSSYSFSQYLDAGRLTQLSCVEQAARMGFDAIEFTDLEPHDGSAPADYALKLKKAANAAGLFISSYTVSADFLNNGDTKAEIKRVKRLVEQGAALGVTFMRHDASSGDKPGANARSFDDVLPILAEACAEVADYASGFGISTMVENHGQFCQASERVIKLYNAVNRANFGLLCDIGNFLCVDEPPESACRAVAPYAIYVHAKDMTVIKGGSGENGWYRTLGGAYLNGAVLGHGDVPVRKCIGILREAGYDGTVSLEYEGTEDCLDGIASGLAFLREIE